MSTNKSTASAVACLGLLLLILDSKTALIGAREGVTLAVTVLVPSLFPFLFLSILLTGSLGGTKLSLLKPVGKFLHIPEGSEGILLPAFLGGYPAGAQAVSQAYGSGRISRKNAESMLSFCNNAGPSFLFGMTSAFFDEPQTIWALWLIHILGAVAAARLYPCSYQTRSDPAEGKNGTVGDTLKQAISIMAVICGWVILFRIVIAFSDRWFLQAVSPVIRTVMIGLLELSNGICELSTIANEKIRFLICSCMLSLGGICVTLQTYSVTEGLDKRGYFLGKGIQLLVSILCATVWIYHRWKILPLLLIPVWIRGKNKSGNPAAVVV